MNIKPLGDRVIVERIDAKDEVRDGGFIVPGSEGDEGKKMTKGVVVAVGTGRRDENISEDEKEGGIDAYFAIPFKVGDTVYFVKYHGNDFVEDCKDYKILDERDVLAVVEK